MAHCQLIVDMLNNNMPFFLRIFRGHIARQYATSLKQAEKERQRKAAVALQR